MIELKVLPFEYVEMLLRVNLTFSPSQNTSARVCAGDIYNPLQTAL